MTQIDSIQSIAIRSLNDDFRRAFIGGAIVITSGVEAQPEALRRTLLKKIREFVTFDADNDPHDEHDFGSIDEAGLKFFWKIDYYDRRMAAHSPDPANPDLTTRVLTIMLAEEY
jgi:Protein of unknown function (DUF3768)